jgi:hypothetical protein
MTQDEIYAQWQKLCAEHDTARDAYFGALFAVNEKFAAIGKGVSSTNPTDDELSEFEKTWERWKDVKRRMDDVARCF